MRPSASKKDAWKANSLVLGEEFFGVLNAGGSDMAAEQTRKLVHAFGRLQTFDDGKSAGFGHSLRDLEMGFCARRDLRKMADAKDLMVSRQTLKFLPHRLRRKPPDAGVNFIKNEGRYCVRLGQDGF